MITWESVRDAFRRDGALRDLYVLEATGHDWDAFLRELPAWGYTTEFYADGERERQPQCFADGYQRHQDAAVTLAIYVGEIQLNCHFFTADEIELDIDPRQLGEREFDELLQFMQRIGDLLVKPVVLTPENEADRPFLRYSPARRAFDTPMPYAG